MKVTIRRESPGDASVIRAVVGSAFGDEGPLIGHLVDILRAHACGRDGLSLVAVDDTDGRSRVVGQVMVTRSRLDTLPQLIDVGVLSPLAVEPAAQGHGVGGLLVAAAIEAAGSARLPALFLEGDPGFYGRQGFVAATPLGFRKPSLRIPDAAFQVRLLDGYETWMTGTLVYAEPFWDLDCVGLREPEGDSPA